MANNLQARVGSAIVHLARHRQERSTPCPENLDRRRSRRPNAKNESHFVLKAMKAIPSDVPELLETFEERDERGRRHFCCSGFLDRLLRI
jgi:hypothetical protein